MANVGYTLIEMKGNHRIINECIELAQKKYKTRYNWVGYVIHRELWRKFKSTLRTGFTCTTQNPSWNMRRINFSGILRYKLII